MTHENLIVGLETSDDAIVYKIDDDLALVQTVDFFTPVVDDPYTFGQIAAANSLSDIYAMGAEPSFALNIIGFPGDLSPDIMAEILKGGASKVIEAGAIVAGGHSVEDKEPKYGLCVSGFINPKKVFKNYGAKENEVLILTKPIGTGILNTAIKASMCSEEAKNEAIHVMSSLNKNAKRIIEKYPVSSCTDVTGFGLIGHMVEMAKGSNVTLTLDIDKVPLIKEALEYAQMGLIPGGAYKNKEFFENEVLFEDMEEMYSDIAYDPQTSGGLLFSIDERYVEDILNEFKEKLNTDFAAVGRVTKKSDKYIIVKKRG